MSGNGLTGSVQGCFKPELASSRLDRGRGEPGKATGKGLGAVAEQHEELLTAVGLCGRKKQVPRD